MSNIIIDAIFSKYFTCNLLFLFKLCSIFLGGFINLKVVVIYIIIYRYKYEHE